MIGRLCGLLLEKQPPYLLVDVQGVGYEVLVPMTTVYQLPELGQEVILHTHLSVSEVAHQLFGFYSQGDRALFRLLIKVSGVGPKMALGILSGMEAHEFARCVQDNNLKALVKVPGVGKKTAERLLIEMRDRLGDWPGTEKDASGAPSAPVARANDMVAEAESALVALGYKPVEAARAVAQVLDQHSVARSEELIRLALRGMITS